MSTKALPNDLIAIEGAHSVHFYEDSTYLVDRVTTFLASGLIAGEAGIIIATAKHREMIDKQLRSLHVDVDDGRSYGYYVDLDADATMAKFMINGQPDRTLFLKAIGGAITHIRQRAKFPIVRAYGEMVAILWARGQQDAAIALEELWNELLGHHPFSIMCGYPVGPDGRADQQAFERIFALHTSVEHQS